MVACGRKMKALSIRGVDEELSHMLRKIVATEKISINQLEKYILSTHLRFQVYSDLDKLAGTWTENEKESFEMGVKDFEKIEPGLWNKFDGTKNQNEKGK